MPEALSPIIPELDPSEQPNALHFFEVMPLGNEGASLDSELPVQSEPLVLPFNAGTEAADEFSCIHTCAGFTCPGPSCGNAGC